MSDVGAFKNFINPQVVSEIASEISKVHPAFDSKSFKRLSAELKALELKARVLHITARLRAHLPDDYSESARILIAVMERGRLTGFSLWPFSEYIGQFGLEHFDLSMKAMYVLTQKFTAEFAVRPFFLRDHQQVLRYFKKWSKDENTHIRRFVSEGSRPLLPWGQKLPAFIKDPHWTLPLLEVLRFDEELYVRKSVANHLNDISKHHPEVVIEALKAWQKVCPQKHQSKLDWIKRQALRTLIKKGHAGALRLMGVNGEAQIKVKKLSLNKASFKVGDKLEFSFELQSTSKKSQKLVVDYAIHFVKANGSTSAKVFKLKTLDLAGAGTAELKKTHSLRPITTMVYYCGVHQLSIHINGAVVAQETWTLKT